VNAFKYTSDFDNHFKVEESKEGLDIFQDQNEIQPLNGQIEK